MPNNHKSYYNNKHTDINALNKERRMKALMSCLQPVSVHATDDLIDQTIKSWGLGKSSAELSLTSQRQYAGKVLAFERFCLENGYPLFPMNVDGLIAYCKKRGLEASYSTISIELKIFRKAHVINGFNSPVDDPVFSVFRIKFHREMEIKAENNKNALSLVGTEMNIVATGGQNKLIDSIAAIDPDLVTAAKVFILENGISLNTEKTYKIQIGHFTKYCEKLSLNISDVIKSKEEIENYFVWYASHGYADDTIQIAKAGIRFLCYLHDLPDITGTPSFSKLLTALKKKSGELRKQKGTKQRSHKKKALVTDEIKQICDILNKRIETRSPNWEKDLRNKVLLLVGFSGAFRGSEYSSRDRHERAHEPDIFFDRRHVTFTEFGFTVDLEKSKTNQIYEIEPVHVGFAEDSDYCAVVALSQWFELLDEKAGEIPECAWTEEGWADFSFPVFPGGRGGKRIPWKSKSPITSATTRRVVKAHVELIGLDAADYGSHSLRSGYVTSANDIGETLLNITTQGRWKSPSTVMCYLDKEKAKRITPGRVGL